MHACKIREPMDTKRWTMVEIDYDLGTRPAHPGRRRQTGPDYRSTVTRGQREDRGEDMIAALVDTQSGMRIVGEASNGNEAVQLHRQVNPDVTLMDLQMPNTRPRARI
jgi:hypothetical protein